MLQRLNKWGRKTLIGCALLAVLAVSVVGSPDVPGKVMQLTGFEVTGIEVSTYPDPCGRDAAFYDMTIFNCFH